MPVNTNNINEIRVGVLGYSVDESASGGVAGSGQWISTGAAGNRTTLNPLASGERILTRIINALDQGAISTQALIQAFDQRVTDLELGGVGGGGYSEDFTASTVWNVDHNLKEQYVLVQVINNSGNIVIPDIEFVDEDTCILRFVKSTTGTVKIRR